MFGGLRDRLEDLVCQIRYGAMDKDVKVLMFHDIGETAVYGPQQYSVTEDHFERVISGFSDTHSFVSLDDVISWLNGDGNLPDKAVAVTFDDGYLSTLKKALPVLQEYDVPATVYVPSNFVEISNPAGFRLFSFLEGNDEASFELEGRKYSFDLSDLEDRRKAYDEVIDVLNRLAVAERSEFLDGIGAPEPDAGKLVSEEELRELDSSSNISIGAHTTDHRKLPELSFEAASKSVKASKEDLQDALGHEISSFSYPFGSTTPELIEFLEDSSFENAVATGNRAISERDWNRKYDVPRLDGKDL